MKRIGVWLLWVLGYLALAFVPEEGMEFLLTDALGERILGYGVVQDGQLRLRVNPEMQEFVLLVTRADGSFMVFPGYKDAAGRLFFVDASGEAVDLLRFLREARVAVTLLFGEEEEAHDSSGPDAPEDGEDAVRDDNSGPGSRDGDVEEGPDNSGPGSQDDRVREDDDRRDNSGPGSRDDEDEDRDKERDEHDEEDR